MTDEPRDGRSTYEESLHLRVTELETMAERQRRTILLLVLGLMAAVALGAVGLVTARSVAGTGAIVAQEFVLNDEDGVPHGTWRIEDGSSRLTLNDQNGVERVRMTVLDNGAPGIALADARGRPRVVLSLQQDLTATLVFADEQENMRAVLGLAPDGSATLGFTDLYGDPRVSVGVLPDGEPTFNMLESGSDESGSDSQHSGESG